MNAATLSTVYLRILLRAVSLMLLLMSGSQNLIGSTLFKGPVDYDAGGLRTSSVAVADLNRDGIVDVVVVNESGSVGVLLGNGDGTFKAVQTYDFANATAVTVGDVNGDGNPDLLVTANFFTLGVFLGHGDGTFEPPHIFGAGSFLTSSIAVGDLNGDGKLDVVVGIGSCPTCGVDGAVGVFIGKGNGSFQKIHLYDTGAGALSPSAQAWLGLALADVNGDGKLDVLVANPTQPHGLEGVVGVLIGRGDGTLKKVRTFSSGGFEASSIAVGDVNGDGHPDLIVGNYCATIQCPASGDGNVVVFNGNGDGTFQSPQTFDSAGYGVVAVAVADLDNDGHLDLVALNTTGHALIRGLIAVLRGDGNGSFQVDGTYSTRGHFPSAIAVVNINGDKRPSLVATNGNDGSGDGSVAVLLGTSN
jgi:uncharacterized protein YfaP (DUF2135 family)